MLIQLKTQQKYKLLLARAVLLVAVCTTVLFGAGTSLNRMLCFHSGMAITAVNEEVKCVSHTPGENPEFHANCCGFSSFVLDLEPRVETTAPEVPHLFVVPVNAEVPAFLVERGETLCKLSVQGHAPPLPSGVELLYSIGKLTI